jgi:hypothetical protein
MRLDSVNEDLAHNILTLMPLQVCLGPRYSELSMSMRTWPIKPTYIHVLWLCMSAIHLRLAPASARVHW